jgi:hypothetical protein
VFFRGEMSVVCHAGIPEKKTGIKLKYKVPNSKKKTKLSNKKQKNT